MTSCARRACATGSTSPRWKRRRRSGPSTCARSRTRSGTCCPGPTFVKTFLRTYADYLGLDARKLVEEYRSRYERPRGAGAGPVRDQPRRPPRRGRAGPFFAPWMAVVARRARCSSARCTCSATWRRRRPRHEAGATPTPTATPKPRRRRQKKEEEEADAGEADRRAAADPAAAGERVRGGRGGRPGGGERHAGRRPGHGDVPLQAVRDVVRHGRGVDAGRRQGVPGVRGRAGRLRGAGGREAAPAGRVRAPDLPG